MPIPEPLKPDQLYTICDPATLELFGEGEKDGSSDSLGQDRAMEAIRFGVGIKREGYNIFAYGAPGTGKHTLIRRHLETLELEAGTDRAAHQGEFPF